MFRPIRDIFFLQLISGGFLLFAPISRYYRSILIRLVVRVAHLRLIIKAKEELNVPSKYGTLGPTREQKLLFAPFDIAKTFLSGWHMERSLEPIGAIHDLIEPNRQIAQTYRNRIPFRYKLNSVDDMGALDARLLLHFDSVVDANHFHVGFEKDHLVDLFEVVNFLDLAVVALTVDDIGGFLVHHVDLCGVFRVIFDLVLDEIRGQVGELDGWRVSLIRPIEQVDKLLNVIFAA